MSIQMDPLDSALLARDRAEEERDEARGERDRLREREAFFATALGVADGGQYRADWPGAMERMIHELAESREALREYGPHCDWVACHGIATARGRDAAGNWQRGCGGLHLADLTDVCDLPHATALRALARRL